MLKALSIRNVVLIEQLDLTFDNGLCALTGETGAGKSILLDALGLALGDRSSQKYVRSGADKAVVSAEFILPKNCHLIPVLEEHGVAEKDTVILRRIVNQDGRTRAFINDHPVGVKLLQEVGQTLIEIHGQFDQLLDPSSHKAFLDHFAKVGALKEKVSSAYQSWRQAEKELKEAEAAAELNAQNEEFLKHAVEELTKLDPQENEEEDLTAQRALLQNKVKFQELLEKAFSYLRSDSGAENKLYDALRSLEKLKDMGHTGVDRILETLDRANQETLEASALLEELRHQDSGYTNLEDIENRLFTLRAQARKHQCQVHDLPEKLEVYENDLKLCLDSETILKDLAEQVQTTKSQYLDVSKELSEKREKAAAQIDKLVKQELPPLKLDRAQFKTDVTQASESAWSESGVDHVQFTVSTNPGANFGPIASIASGGERSRFMLVLKVVLARSGAVPSMIFDEIDSGVGGAVAHAIGERLSRLAEQFQVLVVTHSPQVAAMATHHLRIEKHQGKSKTITEVIPLDEQGRREEVARMLAGDTVTEEARAAADQLLLIKKEAA